MKHWFLIFAFFLALTSIPMLATDSDAARMGGGRSFGGQSNMRTPTAAPRPMQPRQNPSAMPSAPRPSTGLGGMGAMGGLFGGLLAGTVLGSLLGHGGGVGGGGGIGFIDIILLGALIYFGFKFYRRMQQHRPQPETQSPYNQTYTYQDQNYQQPDSAWDGLRDQGSSAGFGAPEVPAGFNVEEFLQGAKQAYVRMQSSWDQRDLDDIANFATPAVMSVLREQLAADPNPSHTELITINVQLMNVVDDGQTQRAQVYFDVLMREDPNQVRPEPAREMWHFVRTLPNGTWKLDGIQQTF